VSVGFAVLMVPAVLALCGALQGLRRPEAPWEQMSRREALAAPLAAPRGADALCRQFDSGGGREGAAGIDFLPEGELGRFARAFEQAYS